MTFSSLVFLCIFLPIVFCLHWIIPSIKVRNGLLVMASLVFYAFGEPVYVLLMIFSSFFNYLSAILIKKFSPKPMLFLSVVVNIGILCVFKYTGMFLNTINQLTGLSLPVPEIALPIGISFFTFQALSYVIDVYRERVEVQKSFPKVLLYISFFPQLIAGPIVKYKDIAEEIEGRTLDQREMAEGFRRFIMGLGKKVLIANAMAVVVDNIFSHDVSSMNILVAWTAAIAYIMQIYYDFSGYSDMAIGLGKMFGFHFRENFDHPYVSVNIKEFWRRWHISLSSWFKDYVYIPLGGNRKGAIRTGINKLIVFFLTGLWHGANWTFVVWGLFHGFFSFLEEFVPRIRKLPRVIGHIYLIIVVTVGFVIFRADSMSQAFGIIGKMFMGLSFTDASMSLWWQQMTPYFIVMLIVAILAAGGVSMFAGESKHKKSKEEELLKESISESKSLSEKENEERASIYLEKGNGSIGRFFEPASYVIAVVILAWCILRLSGGVYNPFIYFRF